MFLNRMAPAEAKAKAKSLIPLGRYGQHEETVRAAVCLASDEASFIMGAALPVDGGFTVGVVVPCCAAGWQSS